MHAHAHAYAPAPKAPTWKERPDGILHDDTLDVVDVTVRHPGHQGLKPSPKWPKDEHSREFDAAIQRKNRTLNTWYEVFLAQLHTIVDFADIFGQKYSTFFPGKSPPYPVALFLNIKSYGVSLRRRRG